MSSIDIETANYLPQYIGALISLTFFIYVLVCIFNCFPFLKLNLLIDGGFIAQLAATFFIFLVRYLTGSVTPSNLGPTVVSVITLTVASLPSGLIPIDVFIVGYMKNSSGHFQQWASEAVRQDVVDTILYTYYGSFLFLFALLQPK